MSTRYTVRPVSRHGVSPLPSGYSEDASTGDVTVPSCGVEDVDRALFNLFDREIPLFVRGNDASETRRVPVIFAAREKWSMIKKDGGVHDKNGSLILPLVTIIREDVSQTFSDDIAGRGANQHTGELIVRRKLSPRDRGYQNIINRNYVRNQANVSVNPGTGLVDGQPLTLRDIGDLSDDPTPSNGGTLMSDRRNNIVETFTVPTPQKITVRYRITLWSQHQQQANSLIEACMSSYLPQTRGWQVETTKGYWFNAFVTSDEYASKGNVTEHAREERIIKHEISVDVPCFILASSAPGLPVHVKRYVSAPVIKFDVSLGNKEDTLSKDVVDEPFLGADDPTLPLSEGRATRRDLRRTGHGRILPRKIAVSESDPALSSLRRNGGLGRWDRRRSVSSVGVTRDTYVRVKSVSPGGETVTSGGFDLGGISVVIVDE